MHKRILSIILVVLSLFLFSACNDKKQDKNDDKKIYSITFESSGGSNVSAIEAKVGEKITKPDNPIKDGYVFVDWYESTDNGKTLSDEPFVFSYMPAKSVKLYAKWELSTAAGKTYKVSDVVFTWGNKEEKDSFEDESDYTEEEFIKTYKEMELTIEFKNDENIVISFKNVENTEILSLIYSIDQSNVITFYQTIQDKEEGKAFSGMGIFLFKFTISKDYSKITLSTNVRPNSVLQIVCSILTK